MKKPAGLTVIRPKRAIAFLDTLPIRRFYGIGPRTAERLEARQVFIGSDLRALSLDTLTELFGQKIGQHYYDLVRGYDPRPIVPYRVRQSLGKERTFGEDLSEISDVLAALRLLSSTVASALQLNGLRGRTVTLKVRYANFESITRSQSFPHPFDDEDRITAAAESLLRSKTEIATRRIRLLGVTVSSLSTAKPGISQGRYYVQCELPMEFF
jgi:DNA polymerase-4